MASILMALALVVAPALAATVVRAQPDPSNSTLPPVIILVGKTANTPDPAGLFEVVVRDASNTPIEGAKVVVEFGGCAQMTISSQQTYSGVTLEQCDPPAVSAFTDVSGAARFVVMGGIADRAAPEGSPFGCGVISASVGADPPVELGLVRVATFDQDGVDGAQFNDVDLWFSDGCLLCDYHQRSDYNGDGAISPFNDLPILLSAVCGGGSEETAARCDGQLANHGVRVAEDGDLYLAWDDCRGGSGSSTKTFACNTNTGSHLLIASFRAPAGVDDLIGFEAKLEVVGDVGVALPEWWRFESGTGCRPTALSILGSDLGFGCPELGVELLCMDVDYPAPGGVINQERIWVEGSAHGALTPGQEYSLLGLQINNSRTIGSGSCAGCGPPVALVLESLRLRQSGNSVVINITAGSSGAVAYWQGVPSGFSITDVPAHPSTTDWLDPPAPNPAHGPVAFRFGLASESLVSVAIYDVAGRRVRVLESGTLPAGEHAATWDGRGERGEALAGGVFFLRLVNGESMLARPVVRIR